MDYICNEKIAFYQEDGGNNKLGKLAEALKVFPCEDYEDILPNWIGFLTRKELGINDDIDDRCLYIFSEDLGDTLRIYTQSINTPKIEVFDKIAQHFDIKYYLLAEEWNNQVFINTDDTGKHFDTEFAVSIICESQDIEEDLKNQLHPVYPSLDTLLPDFEAIGYKASSYEELQRILDKAANEILTILVHQYQKSCR